MKDIYSFQRVETKYLVSQRQKDEILNSLGSFLTPDVHGNSTISSVYLDTANFRIIRNSLEGGVYKEKLRMRSYGTPTSEDKVFLEVKKKYKKVVYKRRVSLSLLQGEEYLKKGILPFDGQVMREIDGAMRFYDWPNPSFLISYEREAYALKDAPDVRLTFDSAVRYRQHHLCLSQGSDGKQVLPDGLFVFELKTCGGMPLFMAQLLDGLKIYPASFSKYKTSYLDFLNNSSK